MFTFGFRKTLRKTRVEKKAGLWEGLKQNIMMGTNILNSRAGRAGEVLNPFRGLSLRHSFPISPFATDGMEEEDQVDSGKDIFFSFLFFVSFPFRMSPFLILVSPSSIIVLDVPFTKYPFLFSLFARTHFRNTLLRPRYR